MGRIVGIDFGEKRTGVAATDPLRIIANGIDTIPTEKIYDFLQTKKAPAFGEGH